MTEGEKLAARIDQARAQDCFDEPFLPEMTLSERDLIVSALRASPSAAEGVEPKVIEFAKWAIRESAFEGCDLDGGVVQERAEKLGLLTKTVYDPVVHGDSAEAVAGDDWYVFSPALSACPATEAQTIERLREVAEEIAVQLETHGRITSNPKLTAATIRLAMSAADQSGGE